MRQQLFSRCSVHPHGVYFYATTHAALKANLHKQIIICVGYHYKQEV